MRLTKEYINSLQSFESESAYRGSTSLNYSTLKKIPDGPRCLTEESSSGPNKAFEIGNYVDRYFTDHDSMLEFYEMEKPKIELNASLEVLYSHFDVVKKNYTPSMEECVAEARKLKLWDSIKDDEKVKSRITDEFFTKLKQNEERSDKIQMTSDQFAQATFAIANIETDEDASRLIAESDGIISFSQFKWEFDMITPSGRVRKFRVMYDKIFFDESKREIYAVDIKTGGKESHKFVEQFIEFRYDIQGILYYFGLLALRKAFFSDWNKPKPENFKFLYSPKKPNRTPIIVSLSDTFIGIHGEQLTYNGQSQDGIFKVIDDADWYIENQEFNRHRILDTQRKYGCIDINKLL